MVIVKTLNPIKKVKRHKLIMNRGKNSKADFESKIKLKINITKSINQFNNLN